MIPRIYADLNWGGPGYAAYDGLMATAAVVPSAPAAPSSAPSTPTGSGAPPASPTGPSGIPATPPASPAGTGAPVSGSPTGTAPTNGNADNIAILRQHHELVQKLGGPQAVQSAVERYSAVRSEAANLAAQLNYTTDSFEEAFAENPVAIVNHLRQEAAEAARQQRANGNANGRTAGDDGRLDRELAPIKQILTRQMAREANNLVESEFNQQLTGHSLFKGKSVPAEVRETIFNHFTDLVKNDNKVQTMVLNGDASGLKAHFDSAIANMVKFANGWGKWTTGTDFSAGPGADNGTGNNANAGQPGSGAPNPDPFKNMRLDDIIEGNPNATKAMASLRNFR